MYFPEREQISLTGNNNSTAYVENSLSIWNCKTNQLSCWFLAQSINISFCFLITPLPLILVERVKKKQIHRESMRYFCRPQFPFAICTVIPEFSYVSNTDTCFSCHSALCFNVSKCCRFILSIFHIILIKTWHWNIFQIL